MEGKIQNGKISFQYMTLIKKNLMQVGTIELAHGINMPSVNPPKTGPPTMPKIPKAAFKNN